MTVSEIEFQSLFRSSSIEWRSSGSSREPCTKRLDYLLTIRLNYHPAQNRINTYPSYSTLESQSIYLFAVCVTETVVSAGFSP